MRFVWMLVLLAIIGTVVGLGCVFLPGNDDSLSEAGVIASIENWDAVIEETERFITQTEFDDHENLSYHYQKLAEAYAHKQELHQWLTDQYGHLTNKYQALASDYERLASDE